VKPALSLRRGAIVLAGIVLGQAILHGPSLVGSKIPLPLDLLAVPSFYLPTTPETPRFVPQDFVLGDLIWSVEHARRFTAAELRAGRLPSWTPYPYGGSRFVFPCFSPFWLLKSSVASPVIIAWAELVLASVAGVGAYLFCRRALQVEFWPATFAAWCYPLTGFFVLWAGYAMTGSVAWLPWVLLAVHDAVTRPAGRSGVALAASTCLVLISGQLDVAGQVLLAAGMYAVWCLVDRHGRHVLGRPAMRSVAAVLVGWSLGFLLASPYMLPLLEYAQSGARLMRRGAGSEERPPIGLAALPETVLPDMYGSTRAGHVPLFPPGQPSLQESATVTYTGLLATLLVAPLAWCSRRHRSANLFWLALGIIGLAWVINIPGLVALLRLPGLNMMSHNRFVFVTSFAVLALMATGLDALHRGEVSRRAWFWLPAGLLLALSGWCVYRAAVPPEPLATEIRSAMERGEEVLWATDLSGLPQIQRTFSRDYLIAGGLCGLAIAGWSILWFLPKAPRWLGAAIGGVLVADLLWFAHGRSPQCDPALYFPRIPVLEEIARSADRFVCYGCLQANLGESHRLRDIRGYDGVDPARWIDLVGLTGDIKSTRMPYALIQRFKPRIDVQRSGVLRLHPILDMLDVRYVVFRGTPPRGLRPDFEGEDYWALTNPNALPRAFVPERVEPLADDSERLRRMGSPEFNPRLVAFSEVPVRWVEATRGSARIVEESSTRVLASVDMQTPGLMVLSDRWDPGWKARLDGRPVPILRVDHALRGVEVPVGKATIEFRYQPASRTFGFRLAGLGLLLSVGWLWLGRRSGAARPSSPAGRPGS